VEEDEGVELVSRAVLEAESETEAKFEIIEERAGEEE